MNALRMHRGPLGAVAVVAVMASSCGQSTVSGHGSSGSGGTQAGADSGADNASDARAEDASATDGPEREASGGAAGMDAAGGSGASTTSGTNCSTTGPGVNDCGPDQESCCTSLLVSGGTLSLNDDDGFYERLPTCCGTTSRTISAFRLDKYDATVGRFREFVNAWLGGWRPGAGSGKHSYLKGGSGLATLSSTGGQSDGGSYESGWDPAWDSLIANDKATWDTRLSCDATHQTWTPSAGANERLPINCVTWYEAYAFCIWDGGFLPTNAELNYAAVGGSQERVYPWSSPPDSTALDCSYANFAVVLSSSCAAGPNAVGSESPKGDGRWGQSDLSGNVDQWALDVGRDACDQCATCSDCEYIGGSKREIRGGNFMSSANGIYADLGSTADSDARNAWIGIRCARAP